MDAHADRLKSRLASLPLAERNRVEMALRARVTAIQDRRFERLLATLTPIERKNRMAEIADELCRRIETENITDPVMLVQVHAMAAGLDRLVAEI
jgi:hypothetical protein